MEGSARDKQGPEGGSVACALGPADPCSSGGAGLGGGGPIVITAVVHLAPQEPAFPDENFTGKSRLAG